MDIFLDAFFDTSRMIPFLLVIYIGIEYVEFKFGSQIKNMVKYAGKAGPAVGALIGCVPQCGFSVITTALYTKRLITLGTLLAVYLSTSDEAIPVILSQPEKVGVIIPLLVTKVVIALFAGYAIEFILTKQKNKKEILESCSNTEDHICAASENQNFEAGNLQPEIKSCCGHSCIGEKPSFKGLIAHPLIHTLKVSAFIFAVTLIINYVIFRIGEENLADAFLSNSILQPVIAGLIGLIPNCASSVAITEVFLKGGISYGSAIAGLSSGAGLGLIVLFKENKNKTEALKIVGLLYGISVTAGILIQYLYG